MEIKNILKVGDILAVDVEINNETHTLTIPLNQVEEFKPFNFNRDEEDENELDHIKDEIDSALDLIADVVSSEELFIIEQKLKEKYGVK